MFQAAKPSSPQDTRWPASQRSSFAPVLTPCGCSPSFLSSLVSTSAPRKPSKTPCPPSWFPRSSTAWPLAPSPPSTPSATFYPASSSDSFGAPSTSRPPSLSRPSYSSRVPLWCSVFEPTPDLLLRDIQPHVSVGE